METVKSGNTATYQKIILATKIAIRDFNSGHLKNPYTHCSVLSQAYNNAALRLIIKD